MVCFSVYLHGRTRHSYLRRPCTRHAGGFPPVCLVSRTYTRRLTGRSIYLWPGTYFIAFSASAMFKRIFVPAVSSVAPHFRSFSRQRLTAAQVKRQLEVVKDTINVRCASICLFVLPSFSFSLTNRHFCFHNRSARAWLTERMPKL